MFKAVPSPDDPTKYIVQSDPMPQDEAEAKAKALNAEEEAEGEGNMPPFGKKPAAPPFGKKPTAPPMPMGGPMGGGGLPPMMGM